MDYIRGQQQQRQQQQIHKTKIFSNQKSHTESMNEWMIQH